MDGRTVEEVWKERRSSGVEPGIDTTTATPARDRSAAEFESLLRAHDRAVRAMAFRIVGTDVDDVQQQAYLKAFLCWDRFRCDATFGTWLHRIVYTTCLDHVRSSDRRHRAHERAAVRDRTADTTDAVADLIVLAHAVDALPVDQRVTLLLVDALQVPDAASDFWNDVHAALLHAADQRPADVDEFAGRTVEVRPITSAPSARARRLALAGAALLLVAGGLVVARAVRLPDTVPAERSDVVIDDPRAIDLDALRSPEHGFEPNPTGPYAVFDLADLGDGWTASPGEGYGWQLTVRGNQAADVTLPEGDPVTVRGVPGIAVTGPGGDSSSPFSSRDAVVWQERSTTVTMSSMSSASFDLDTALELAARLQPIEVDRLDATLSTPPGMTTSEPSAAADTILLAGVVDGWRWRTEQRETEPGSVEVELVVDGGGGGSSTGSPDAPFRQVSNLGGRGRVYVGRADRALATVEVDLSDGHVITLPVVADGINTLWAVPIPVGLDVVAIRLMPGDEADPVTTIRVLRYSDQGGSEFTA